MKRKPIWTGTLASLGILLLILDSKTALKGAQTGLDLCIRTVIPSLFPFFFLSNLLVSAFSGMNFPFLSPLTQLLGIPKGAESILLAGFLGGYPVGAQIIGQNVHSGILSRQDGERMLAFCNNAGPAFLFGMAGPLFPEAWMPWALWGIHLGSAVLTALTLPVPDPIPVESKAGKIISPSAALSLAVKTMAVVCGWVLIFRVIIVFCQRWLFWYLPEAYQAVISGFLELANGCCALASIDEIPVRFLLCSGFLAFGGLCVTMQTVSVTKGLPLRLYFRGKAMQILFSLLLSVTTMVGFGLPCYAVLFLFLYILRKWQKRSSIQAVPGV